MDQHYQMYQPQQQQMPQYQDTQNYQQQANSWSNYNYNQQVNRIVLPPPQNPSCPPPTIIIQQMMPQPVNYDYYPPPHVPVQQPETSYIQQTTQSGPSHNSDEDYISEDEGSSVMSYSSGSVTNDSHQVPQLPNNAVGPDGLPLRLVEDYKIPRIPVVYHRNMAREFPGTETRTPEQQIQRKRNTEAARQSRAKAKVLEQLVENESKEAHFENVNSKRILAAQHTYANLLLKQMNKEEVDWSSQWEKSRDVSKSVEA